MVINIGRMLGGDYDYVEREIKALAELCHDQEAILKVIIETCYLSDEQKVKACQLSESAGADFVKTSTGYGTAGAKIADVALMRRTVSVIWIPCCPAVRWARRAAAYPPPRQSWRKPFAASGRARW